VKGFKPGLTVIIIDEVSMMTLAQLHELDLSLRKSTDLPLLEFGGITIVLSGDFYQMPPVGSSMMYLKPQIKEGSSDVSTLGYKLWKKFTNVIYLDENNRFINDKDWGIGCYYARKGVWLPEFVKRMNKNVFTSLYQESSNSNTINCKTYIDNLSKHNITPQFVSPDNLLRHLINQQYSLLISSSKLQLKSPIYPIRIVAQFNTKLKRLSKVDQNTIMSLLDNKLERISPFIDFVFGMPITVTQNINTSLGICNGTFGKAIDIQFPSETKFCDIIDANSGATVLIPSKPPSVIIILTKNGRTCPYLPGNTSTNIYK
jgi:hypothetical protein